jgi:hypothetical protein
VPNYAGKRSSEIKIGGGRQIAVSHGTATLAVHTAMPITFEFFCNMTSCLLVNCVLLFLGC